MKVRDPEGQVWRVRRRPVPWRRRAPGFEDIGMDYHSSPFDDPVSAVVGLCLLIVLLPLVFVAYFTIGRFTTIFLVLLSVGAVRLLFGDTFTVEVKQGRTAHWETRAGNWRASGKVIREKAEEIRNGTPPERNIL